MICPQCKCEYIRGVTRCADCGVALVDELPPEWPAIPDDIRLVAVWTGDDPAEFERVAAALEEADIPYTKANSRSLFGSRPNESTQEIWVSIEDQEKANEVVGSLEDSGLSEELTAEQSADLSLPDSDGDGPDENDDVSEDLSEEWHEDDPVTEVWSGDNKTVADNLILCLREIGIASRALSEGGEWRVVVRPPQENRARRIVREVVDGVPPQ